MASSISAHLSTHLDPSYMLKAHHCILKPILTNAVCFVQAGAPFSGSSSDAMTQVGSPMRPAMQDPFLAASQPGVSDLSANTNASSSSQQQRPSLQGMALQVCQQMLSQPVYSRLHVASQICNIPKCMAYTVVIMHIIANITWTIQLVLSSMQQPSWHGVSGTHTVFTSTTMQPSSSQPVFSSLVLTFFGKHTLHASAKFLVTQLVHDNTACCRCQWSSYPTRS